MAIIKYDTPPSGPSDFGPGAVRRQTAPGLYTITGPNNPSRNPTNQERFTNMTRKAADDWHQRMSASERQDWYREADRIHHSRPGDAGTNTHKQPFSRFLTAAGYAWFWPYQQTTLPPIGTIGQLTAINITAYHQTPPSLDIAATIYGGPTGYPTPMLDFYHLRPGCTLPPKTWHNFRLACHFTDIYALWDDYEINVPLKWPQFPGTTINLWARFRNGQDANDYHLLPWPL
jgi:hypothetical protein